MIYRPSHRSHIVGNLSGTTLLPYNCRFWSGDTLSATTCCTISLFWYKTRHAPPKITPLSPSTFPAICIDYLEVVLQSWICELRISGCCRTERRYRVGHTTCLIQVELVGSSDGKGLDIGCRRSGSGVMIRSCCDCGRD